jgi:DNA-binding winged helix-turn-helix (wHTH) protein
MLRRALAEAGIDCVETIPKRGYRLTRALGGHRLGDRALERAGQRRGFHAVIGSAMIAVASAVTPIANPPQPGMDVNALARSIASRM